MTATPQTAEHKLGQLCLTATCDIIFPKIIDFVYDKHGIKLTMDELTKASQNTIQQKSFNRQTKKTTKAPAAPLPKCIEMIDGDTGQRVCNTNVCPEGVGRYCRVCCQKKRVKAIIKQLKEDEAKSSSTAKIGNVTPKVPPVVSEPVSTHEDVEEERKPTLEKEVKKPKSLEPKDENHQRYADTDEYIDPSYNFIYTLEKVTDTLTGTIKEIRKPTGIFDADNGKCYLTTQDAAIATRLGYLITDAAMGPTAASALKTAPIVDKPKQIQTEPTSLSVKAGDPGKPIFPVISGIGNKTENTQLDDDEVRHDDPHENEDHDDKNED